MALSEAAGSSTTAADQMANRAWAWGRIVGLDMARWLALIGMIATHALVAVTPEGAVTLPQSIAGGRASALFAVLAGVSMALMSGRRRPLAGRELRGVAAGLLVRAALIAAIGLVLREFGSSIAIILTYYGALFALGVLFLRLRARTLALLAACWVVLAPLISFWLRPMLPEREYGSPSASDLVHPVQLATELLFTGYYPAFTWLAYLLVGMAVGRSALDRSRTGVVLLVVGSAVAAGASLVSGALLGRPGVMGELEATLSSPPGRGGLELTLEHGLFGTIPTGSGWWLAVATPHSGTTFDLARTGGSALAVIGACLLVSRVAPRTLAVVFGAGAMPLTLYSLHVILRSPDLLPGDDPATFGTHVLLVTMIGAAYRLMRRSGPLERMVAAAAAVVRRRVEDRLTPSPDSPAARP